MSDALVIGGGPAGLMAAGELAQAGHSVIVAEAMPSVGRKLLMAGKSGLNLTKADDPERFLAAYTEGADWLAPMLAEFGPNDVRRWAEGLGQELFTGSTGRVFPKVMKASPLLRAWLARLGDMGVGLRTRWRWRGWDGDALLFDTPDGSRRERPAVTVLALGGASWRRLGSDGAWAEYLRADGTQLSPFAPSNAALSVVWSAHMSPHFGAALKSVKWQSSSMTSRGEAVISARGLEGGGLYALTPALRDGNALNVDLLPDLSQDALSAKLTRKAAKQSAANWLKTALRLPPAKTALFFEMAPDRSDLTALKSLPIRHAGLRPLDEAISTAGGVQRPALTDELMLRNRPGTFCAGEMLDWDAPTGGYLLTACLATGRWAGKGAARYLAARP